MKRLAITFAAVAMIALPVSAFALSNGGFETDDTSGGDVYCASSWSCFGDVFSSSMSAPPFEGSNVLKIFGPFGGAFGGAGAVQAVPAAPGQTWVAECQGLRWSGDLVTSGDFAVLKIEFLDAGFALLPGGAGVSVFESNALSAATPVDTWTLLGVGTAPAPAGTAYAQAVIVKVNVDDGGAPGSFFFDDSRMFQDTPTATEESSWGGVKELFR